VLERNAWSIGSGIISRSACLDALAETLHWRRGELRAAVIVATLFALAESMGLPNESRERAGGGVARHSPDRTYAEALTG